MKKFATIVFAAGMALGLSLSAAQAQAPAPQKLATPAAIAAAKEILALKNTSGFYAGAVPGTIQQVMNSVVQNNLNYQKDLQEVAALLATKLAGRENEIGEQWAKNYASDFTEQELKDLVTFYKSPLGAKLIQQEPKTGAANIAYMRQWAQSFAEEVNGQFRAEMRKRGKEI
jgi:hypothetical protein